jgi:hypothetical protein
MRGERSVRIRPARLHLDRHARQVELMRLERHDVVPLDVPFDDDAGVRRAARRRADAPVELLGRLLQVVGEHRQRGGAVARVLGHEHDVEGRPVVHQQLAEAVVDQSARRRQTREPDAVVLGRGPHVAAANDLQEPQSGDQQRDTDGGDRAHHDDPPHQRRRHFARHDPEPTKRRHHSAPKMCSPQKTSRNTNGASSAALAACPSP